MSKFIVTEYNENNIAVGATDVMNGEELLGWAMTAAGSKPTKYWLVVTPEAGKPEVKELAADQVKAALERLLAKPDVQIELFRGDRLQIGSKRLMVQVLEPNNAVFATVEPLSLLALATEAAAAKQVPPVTEAAEAAEHAADKAKQPPKPKEEKK